MTTTLGQKWMRKSGAGLIEASHRLAMCRLLVEQEHRSDWVAVSSWEVDSPQGFHDFPVVARYHNQHLRERLSALLGEKEDQKPLLKLVSRLRLFYLCGADHASNCFFFIKGGIPALPQIGIVAVGRPGYTEQLKRFSQISARREGGGGGKGQEEETLHFILVESEMQDTSSTLIRKRLAAGQSIADLTGSAVADYIESNDLRKLFAYLP
ncbi:Nicotinamide/nicotinic acid mononucleotide adenylyltransferase 2, variant 2 [Balamuthia mandrillaris]